MNYIHDLVNHYHLAQMFAFIFFVSLFSFFVVWCLSPSTDYSDKWASEPPHENDWKRYENMMVLKGSSCEFYAPSFTTRIARWNGIVYGGERAGTCRVTVWARQEWGSGYLYTRVDYTDQQADMFMDVMRGFSRNEQSRISGAAEAWAKEVYKLGTSQEISDKYNNFDYCTYMNDLRKLNAV
jgi:hypothetical protein